MTGATETRVPKVPQPTVTGRFAASPQASSGRSGPANGPAGTRGVGPIAVGVGSARGT